MFTEWKQVDKSKPTFRNNTNRALEMERKLSWLTITKPIHERKWKGCNTVKCKAEKSKLGWNKTWICI